MMRRMSSLICALKMGESSSLPLPGQRALPAACMSQRTLGSACWVRWSPGGSVLLMAGRTELGLVGETGSSTGRAERTPRRAASAVTSADAGARLSTLGESIRRPARPSGPSGSTYSWGKGRVRWTSATEHALVDFAPHPRTTLVETRAQKRTTAASIHSLPAELVALAFANAGPATLRNAALVSRTWRDAAQFELHRDVVLVDTDQIKRYCASVESSTRCARYKTRRLHYAVDTERARTCNRTALAVTGEGLETASRTEAPHA